MNYINFKELYACFVAWTTFLYMGLSTGFSTEYIYQHDSGATKLTNNEASWIGGSGLMLTFVGCFINGYIMDKFGRKSLFYTAYGIHVIGWMIIAKTAHVIFGRILISLAIGLGYGSVIYIAEILQPDYRGAFISLTSVFEIFGSLLIYFVEYYISAETVSLALSIFSLLLFISIFFVPETPYYYMLKKKKSKAIQSLTWLRDGNEMTIDFEIQEMEKNLDDINNVAPTFVETIFNVRWWKTFSLFSVYVILTEITGFDMIIPYSVQFFNKFNRTHIDDRIISMIFITLAFIGTIVTVLVIENFNRVPLVKYTNLANVVFLLISAFSETYFHSMGSSILSLLSFCIYGTTVSITAYTVPWAIISESLPTESRATIFAALATEFSFIYFIIVKIFPAILISVPVNYIIYSFAFFSFLNYVFVHCFMKETRGIMLPGNRST